MIISHRKRFIFVHIYKVAGTSVRSALKPYADITFKKYTPRRIFYVFGLAGSPGDHSSARELKDKLGTELFENYFKFAFVRNPWDWQVSLYHYICSHPFHPQNRVINRLGSFQSYLEWRINQGVELQKYFVTDSNGKLLVDFIGRYETLSRDFSSICERLDISSRLPHKNPSQHNDYRHYYNDYTAQLIADYYRDDIDFFGYSFDGIALPNER